MSEGKPSLRLRLASCPKCSAAIAKAKLARMPDIQIVRSETPANPYCRSSYDVMIKGELRGYITCDSGWGASWNLYELGEQRSHYVANYLTGKRVSGERIDYYDWKLQSGDNERRVFWPVHWASKEGMAVAAYAAWQRGMLPTLAEQAEAERVRREEAEAAKVERAAAQARYEAKRIEDRRVRDERLEAWRLAYIDLAARPDLSNLERAGIEAAQALIFGS